LKLLLDTHLLLWIAFKSSKLSAAAVSLIEEPANELWFSTVSIWEVAVKSGRKRADFSVDPRILQSALLRAEYLELGLNAEHTFAIMDLPSIHKDPFDRILIAQAHIENITLLTSDAKVARYPGAIILV
jgi:PIN domain nuclease of toxin-antitoxin system